MGGRGAGSGVVNGKPRALVRGAAQKREVVVVIHKFSGVDLVQPAAGGREPVLVA